MNNRVIIWGTLVLVILTATAVAPWLAHLAGDGYTTSAFAFSTGGPGGFGYDYLGRPVLPQLLAGGRALLLAAAGTAVVSQLLGLAVGLWLATRAKGSAVLRFVLDVALVLPLVVTSLIAYTLAGSSLYATIPITTALTVPFTSRYYQANAEPLLRSPFFEQARVAGDRLSLALVREIVPVLARPILTDLGLATITAIYLMSTISFLGASSIEAGFLWPTMAAKNLSGMALNPWATLAPLGLIVALTVPLNMLTDALGAKNHE